MTWLVQCLQFFGFLAVACLLFTAAVVVSESRRPRPVLTTDHERVALEDTSATPIYEALAVEVFMRELDEQIREGLAGWGREDESA